MTSLKHSWALVVTIIVAHFAFASVAHGAIYMKYDGVDGSAATKPTVTTELQVSGTLSVSSGTFEVNGRVGQSYVLDGTQSKDDDMVRVYAWKQVSGPTVALTDAGSIKPTFTPAVAGTYVFELVATDTRALKSTIEERVQFNIEAQAVAPSPTPPVIDGGTVKGEGSAAGSANGGVWKMTDSDAPDDEKLTPVLLELDGVKGESPKKGDNVEHEWKVEEGESVRDEDDDGDVIDTLDEGDEMVRGGGVYVASGDINGLTEEEKAELLAKGMGVNTRSETPLADRAKIALLNDPILTSVKIEGGTVEVESEESAKLFGFIDVPLKIVVVGDVDADGSIMVKMPWWSFLATTDFDADGLEQKGSSKKIDSITIKQAAIAEMLSSISNVLKTKHDTAKNAIGNVR